MLLSKGRRSAAGNGLSGCRDTVGDGNPNGERAAPVGRAFDPNGSAKGFDAVVGVEKPQAGAVTDLPGGEKGIEDVGLVVFGDSDPRIRYRDHHMIAVFSGPEGDGSLVADGLDGVFSEY